MHQKSIAEHQFSLASQIESVGGSAVFIDTSDAPSEPDAGPHNFPFIRVSNVDEFMREKTIHNPDYVFLGTPYPEHYPKWFVEQARAMPIAYAGYALPVKVWNSGAYENDFLGMATLILASSRKEFKRYKRAYPLTKVLLTGNPVLWDLTAALRLRKTAIHRALPRKSILWAPHWSPTWEGSRRGFGRFNETGRELVSFLKDNTMVSVTFRPHPILLEALHKTSSRDSQHNRESASLAEVIDQQLVQEVLRLADNGQLSFSVGGMLDDVLQNDLLITEGVSIFGYWAHTGKPMLLIRDEDSPVFDYPSELITKLAAVSKPNVETRDFLYRWRAEEGNVNKKMSKQARKIFTVRRKSPGKQVVGLVRKIKA